MVRIILFFFILIPFLSAGQVRDKIDSFITLKIKERHIPGLAFAVIKDGEVIRKSVYGISNIEHSTTVNEHTVFEIASMTKQFTCAAILLLEQDGKLSLTERLSKYINDLPGDWNNITLYQLMNHTAGLKDDWDEPTSYFLENHTDSKMLLAQQKQKLLFKPGEGHYYSSGPFFLGLVIEKITGKPYPNFLRERIFLPLHMTCTSVFNDSTIISNRASGYWWKNNKLQNGVDIPQAAESRADVGIISCINDMIKWSRALKGTNLLNKESLHKMFTPGMLNNGKYIPYGLGWYIYPFRSNVIYEHGGAFRTGFNSKIIFFPEKNIEIIVLCNLWRSGMSSIVYDLANYFIPDFKLVSKSNLIKDDPKLINRFEQLFHQLAKGLIAQNELYKQVNISGFDVGELAEMLKGFKSLQLVNVQNLKSKPIKLYGKEISEIYFYQALADKPTIWSFHLTREKELVSVNLEE
jgi:D-alanyl-D-alanine carboxypeptidase